jgi:hypothetical protein
MGHWLSAQELYQLYTWLDSEITHGRIIVEQFTDFRNTIVGVLQEKASVDACNVLDQLQLERPTDWQIKRAAWEARSRMLETTWTPIDPPHIRRMVEDTRQRLVRNEQELLESVIDALAGLQDSLRDEGGRLMRLWNESHKDNRMIYRPKPEEPLSREIALSLRDQLQNRGITAHLEEKIREGEFVDIHVNAVSSDATKRTISLVIEVKGCWHKDLQTALCTQLAERYLKDNQSRYGLFLVVWFLCDKWEPDNRKDYVPDWTVEKAQDIFTKQAKEVSRQTRTEIRAVVLNATLH